MSSRANLGKIDRTARTERRLTAVRLLLPVGWALAAIGYLGSWLAHDTAALTLSGVDMGAFTKFLPGVLDGSLDVIRPFFYLPPFVVVVSVALLIGARRLRYAWPVRVLALVLAVPVSLQLLPPAWSPATLMTSEFRLQALALVVCWLLLAGFWLLGRLPSWLSGLLSAVLALAAGLLSAWQFLAVKPAIDAVYRTPPGFGWGFFVCMVGLLVLTVASVLFVQRVRRRDVRRRGESPWANE
jgi:hypothetical protein